MPLKIHSMSVMTVMGLISTKLSLLDNTCVRNTRCRILLKKVRRKVQSPVLGQTDGRALSSYKFSFFPRLVKQTKNPKKSKIYSLLLLPDGGSEKNSCKKRSSFNVLAIDFITNFLFAKFTNFSSFFKRLFRK